MKHDFYTQCESGDCGGTCVYCCLAICKVCNLGEGELTTHCPGEPSQSHGNAVYQAREDFRDGRWIRSESPHSPNSGQQGVG